jgi:hypothetical protein
MRDEDSVNETLVVRIYRRLQTMEFDGSIFRREPLIFLAIPSSRWMQTGQVFWNDAGPVFDEKFGCAKLTYEQEELQGFFTCKLGVLASVPEQQLAEVWAQMSSGEVPTPDVVEKRLGMILEKLVKIVSTEGLPDWWAQTKSRLKVWTTAKHFDAPADVYARDDTFAKRFLKRRRGLHGNQRTSTQRSSIGCLRIWGAGRLPTISEGARRTRLSRNPTVTRDCSPVHQRICCCAGFALLTGGAANANNLSNF